VTKAFMAMLKLSSNERPAECEDLPSWLPLSDYSIL